ncbi:MAG: CDP-diacylglycerol--glycerol-3-phosphate 3-phosphatidyltransferase, partial [Bdellovibrionales bacterium]|nr:CDP-diacylglycerol--glycerol-3-phosphate 3-phosphatidyltransferase [Bdellovibrionales bacterium]
ARKYQAESAMGKFMDPIADKLLILAALIMLLHLQVLDPLMVFILLARDIFIGGIRAVAAANNVIISAKAFGKWKTAMQMVAIPLIFVHDYKGWALYQWGYWTLWLSVILSLISGIQYTWGYYTGRQDSK